MLSPDALIELGLFGLFLASFLAGSILPFPSEAVLAGLIHAGASSPLTVAVGTAGNVLGAVTVYAVGMGLGSGLALPRLRKRFGEESLAKAKGQVERWGSWCLLFSWVPIVGDTLVLGAGLAGLRPWLCLLLVTLGKAARYGFVAWGVVALT